MRKRKFTLKSMIYTMYGRACPSESLPISVSERQACDVLDVCRNSLRAARQRYYFCGPPNPYRRKGNAAQIPKLPPDWVKCSDPATV